VPTRNVLRPGCEGCRSSALRIVLDAARGQAAIDAVPPAGSGELPGLDLTLAEWAADSFPFSDFDRYAEALAADAPGGAFEIRLSGEAGRLAPAARQVALRCQRLAGRRNDAFAGELCDRVLACHRRLHGMPRPRAAASYAHALDTWQWLLRLDPEAGLALQLAALFHEAWRLVPEHDGGDRPDLAAGPAGRTRLGREHASGQARPASAMGAWMADELLADMGLDLATRVHVHRLIAGHQRPPADGDQATAADRAPAALATGSALLDDADALSLLSLDSARYLCEFGADSTARLVARALARLRPAARAWLRELRLHRTVALMLESELPPAGAAVVRPDVAPVTFPAASYQTQAATPPTRSTSAAVTMARKRLAAGMAGGAGLARTRVGALLARAAVLGDLAVHPAGQGTAAAARARSTVVAMATAQPTRAKRSAAAACRDA
jgi:hypothetical protein